MVRNIYKFFFVFLFAYNSIASAQDADILINDDIYPLINRLAVKGVSTANFPLEHKPYPREWLAEWLQTIDTSLLRKAEKQRWERAVFLVTDKLPVDSVRGIQRYIYNNRRDFICAETKHFNLYLNPGVYLSLGQSRQDTSRLFTYQNTRGVSLRATLFNKIGLYTDFFDTQARFPHFVNDRIKQYGVIWGEGFYKTFGNGGYDYLSARGYLTYSPVKAIRIKFGWDRNFIGNGIQSMFLSDYAPEYLQLLIRSRFGKFEYTNLFTQFIDYFPGKPDGYGAFPRKYGAFHTLSYSPTPKISLGIFESVIYGSQQPNAARGFELQYLNPIIFYRTVEQFIGSPDNSMLGLQGRFHLLRRIQLYGQFVIDDYNLGMRKVGPGWWGNKIAYQVGIKWIDALFIPNLDAGVEFNHVRPYTFAHYSSASNYGHYGQFLAHSSGANLQEIIIQLHYQPLGNLSFSTTTSWLQQGMDKDGENYGANIFRPMLSHTNGTNDPDFNNYVLQGNLSQLFYAQFRISYQIMRLNAYIDVDAGYRKISTPTINFNQSSLTTTLRYQLPSKPTRF